MRCVVGLLDWATTMTHIYFDESIHNRAGFILGAYVCGPDADIPVARAIERVGLMSGVDEYKSSSFMREHPEQAVLREALREVLDDYHIGVL